MITKEQLKTRRKKLKLSLKDVQRKTGLSNSYLSQIENGTRNIILSDKFIKVLNLYGYKIDIVDSQRVSDQFRGLALKKVEYL